MAHFVEKNSFCKYLSPFTGFNKKSCLKYSNFLQYLPISNMIRKTNFLSISVLVSGIVTFMSKKKSLYEFPPKCFKTTERFNLAVCGSLCREKKFLLLFILYYWFVQNSCLNKSKFSSGFAPFQIW